MAKYFSNHDFNQLLIEYRRAKWRKKKKVILDEMTSKFLYPLATHVCRQYVNCREDDVEDCIQIGMESVFKKLALLREGENHFAFLSNHFKWRALQHIKRERHIELTRDAMIAIRLRELSDQGIIEVPDHQLV